MVNEVNYLDTGIHLVGTGGLLGIVLYFVKKWMNARENAEVEIRKDVADKVEKVAFNLETIHARNTSDIKGQIQSNRDYYTQTYGDIKCSIDKLSDHVANTNGRLGKTEGAIASITTLCQERSKAFYRNLDEERRKDT